MKGAQVPTDSLNPSNPDSGKGRAAKSYGASHEMLLAFTILGISGALKWADLIRLDIVTVLTVLALLVVVILGGLSTLYGRIMANTRFSVDDYGHMPPSFGDRLHCAFVHCLTSGRVMKKSKIELGTEPSPYIEGLKLNLPLKDCKDKTPLKITDPKNSVIVGSIRMGFGHHRIAQSASTWGVGLGIDTYFHDLLSITSHEADLIVGMDGLYSKGSRLAASMGGFVEKAWGKATMSGGENALRNTWLMGEAISALMEPLDKSTPVVCSHSLVGATAVAAGFKNVVNCVIDNYAQWFCVAPGAINITQGPGEYAAMIRMGVPSKELRQGGHWVPKPVVDNLVKDTEARLARAKSGAPRRILIPIGGAGAQKEFVQNLVRGIAKLVKQGKVQLFLNAGDRKPMHKAMASLMDKLQLHYERVTKYDRLKEIIADPSSVEAPVVLLTFEEYFPAMCCTDMLVRICDVMAVKPSELAFYPIPKIMIRRVGDHEQWSAVRASEIGDGTAEVRESDDAIKWVNLFSQGPDLFTVMCNCILNNHSVGVYNGSKIVIETAMKMARGEAY